MIDLRVKKAKKEDVYRDTIRIPERYRRDKNGNIIPEGEVCRVSVGKHTAYALLRGTGNDDKPYAYLDERLRNELNVEANDDISLQIQPVCLVGQFRWAWSASDPAYRVAARLGLLSLLLGIIGFALGLISIYISRCSC